MHAALAAPLRTRRRLLPPRRRRKLFEPFLFQSHPFLFSLLKLIQIDSIYSRFDRLICCIFCTADGRAGSEGCRTDFQRSTDFQLKGCSTDFQLEGCGTDLQVVGW